MQSSLGWPSSLEETNTYSQQPNPYQITGPNTLTSAHTNNILRSATKRWLSKQEVVDLFVNCIKGGLNLCFQVPQQPPSGTVIMYRRDTMARRMRKDGHEWVKKSSNSNSTREDHKTLKHGVWVIACYYAHGRDINIHRRVYSLHKRAANGSLVKNCFGINLVHYLMDNFTRAKSSPAKASPPAGHLRIATDNNNLLPQHTLWRGDASSSTHDPPNDSDPTSLLESPLLGPAHRALSPNEMSLSSDFSLDSSLLGLSPEMRQVQNFGHEVQNFGHEVQNYGHEVQNYGHEVQNFGHESRSHSSAPALMHTETQVPSSGLPAITAHSPHWSLLEGGECMLLVVSEALSAAFHTVITFGAQACPTRRIAPNVLSCRVPPRSTAGIVEVFLSQGCARTPSIDFEYRDLVPRSPRKDTPRKRRHAAERAREKTSAPRINVPALDRYDERATKIRFVEKLENVLENAKSITQVPKRARPPAKQRATTPRGESVSRRLQLLDDKALETLSEVELAQRSQDLVMRVVSEVNALGGLSTGPLPEVDSQDDEGLSLLHYACLFNCKDVAVALLEHRADANIVSSSGQTPLQMARARGHDSLVEIITMNQNATGTVRAWRANDDHDLVNQVIELIDDNNDDDALMMQIETIAAPQSPPQSELAKVSPKLTADEAEVRSETLQEKLLTDAFASMSLHQRCALSLAKNGGTKGGKAVTGEFLHGLGPASKAAASKALSTNDGQSWASVLKLMTDEDKRIVLKEASTIQANVRAWMMRNNYRNIRDSILSLQAMSRGMIARKELRREQEAATKIKAGMKGFLARKEFKQLKTHATTLQAAWRSRKSPSAMVKRSNLRKHLSAALVIQRAWISRTKRKE